MRICVENDTDPITAIKMASLNAAECFDLKDRGTIAPGLRADIVLFDDLETFSVSQVFIKGKAVAKNGNYLPDIKKHSIEKVRGRFTVKEFSEEKLKLKLESNNTYAINILIEQDGGIVVTKNNQVINTMPKPIGGIMSDQSGQ